MSKYGKLSLAALTALVLAGSAFQAASAEPAAAGDGDEAFVAAAIAVVVLSVADLRGGSGGVAGAELPAVAKARAYIAERHTAVQHADRLECRHDAAVGPQVVLAPLRTIGAL